MKTKLLNGSVYTYLFFAKNVGLKTGGALCSSNVTTICLMQRNTSTSHRVEQAVNCGLWNVVSLLFNGRMKLLDIGGNWNMLSYMLIQSIPNMLNGLHVL